MPVHSEIDMTVLVLTPHPDDEMIGMGGTIAKLAAEGERVVVVVFTLGEGSHPWQRKEAINKTREQEALAAGKIAGTSETIFLRIADGKISTEVVEKGINEEVLKIIKQEKPRMIFAPAIDDIHPDHRAVARFIVAMHDKNKLEMPVWTYTVWNPLHVKGRDRPRMVMDISKTFNTKWRAIQAYQSQKVSTYQLIPTVMLRGFIHGVVHGYSMAEVFLKAR